MELNLVGNESVVSLHKGVGTNFTLHSIFLLKETK